MLNGKIPSAISVGVDNVVKVLPADKNVNQAESHVRYFWILLILKDWTLAG